MVQANRDRLLLEHLMNKRYAGNKNVRMTIGSLRQEKVLKNNESNYNFTFKERNEVQLPEHLLNIEDAFFAHSLFIGVRRVDTAAPGAGAIYTYPSPVEFPDSGTDFINEHLEALYAGRLTIENNSDIIYKDLDMLRFRKVVEGQKIGTSTHAFYDEFDLKKMAEEVEPYFVMSGGNDNRIGIKIASFPGIKIESATAGVEHRIVVMPLGVRVYGGATFLKK